MSYMKREYENQIDAAAVECAEILSRRLGIHPSDGFDLVYDGIRLFELECAATDADLAALAAGR